MDVSELIPRTALAPEVLRAAVEAVGQGRRAVIATVVARHGSAPSTPGQKLVLADKRGDRRDDERDGTSTAFEAIGTIGGGAVERVVLSAMVQALEDPTSEPRLTTFRLGASLGMCCGGSVEILIEPLRPPLSVLVVGGGHVGVAVAPVLASLGFRVIVCDAREVATDPARVAALTSMDSVRVLQAEHDDPAVLAALGTDPGHAAALVMTHDHQLDQAAIEWALSKRFAFVGGVGSRAKAARTRARLEAKNVSEADVGRVRMPIGVDIGARTPAEIAVAIGAELVAWRAARSEARTRAAAERSDQAERGDQRPLGASAPGAGEPS